MKIFNYKLGKFDVIGGSLTLLITITIFIKDTYERNQLKEQINEKYEDITLSTKINGTVKDTYYPREWRGEGYDNLFVTLSNGRGINIFIRDFLEVEKKQITNFVKPGAKIIKSKGTDSLLVLYGGERHFVKVYTD